MSELHDSVDYNNLKFEYVGPAKDVKLYEYMDSKELFNAIKNDQIRFNVLKRQDGFLNKLSDVKMGKKKILSKKRLLIILINFTFLKKKSLIF